MARCASRWSGSRLAPELVGSADSSVAIRPPSSGTGRLGLDRKVRAGFEACQW